VKRYRRDGLMGKAVVRAVTPVENGVQILVEFDFKLTDKATEPFMTTIVNVAKDEFNTWKESNATGTFDEYVLEQVKTAYDRMNKTVTLASGLINKELTW
jgi:hypothetical protein